MRNTAVLETEPWGTSVLVVYRLDVSSLTATLNILSVKKF